MGGDECACRGAADGELSLIRGAEPAGILSRARLLGNYQMLLLVGVEKDSVDAGPG